MDSAIPRNFIRTSVPKCFKCEHYLSMGPITLISNRPVCGRCTNDSPDGSGLFYENLAQGIIFPCINDIHGCDVTCPWERVASHEKTCRFAPIQCPALDCDKKIPKEGVINHFNEDHVDLISSNSDFIVPKKEVNECMNKIFTRKNKVFIVKTNFIGKSCFCSLLSWEKPTLPNLKYTITIEDEKKIYSVRIRNIDVKKYETKLHDVSEMTKIDVELTRNFMNTERLVCSFSLGNASSVEDSLNNSLLRELECPICTEYMRPPIFSCPSGHCICSSCITKITRCSFCQLDLSGSRIIAMEKMAEYVEFPCRFIDSGCIVTGILSSLLVHESGCIYRSEAEAGCYLNWYTPCEWRGENSRLISHIATAHPDSYVNIKYSIVLDMTVFRNMNAFTEYDNHIFKVIIDQYNKELHVTVKLVVDQCDIEPIYHFLLDFRDPNNCNRFLYLNNICAASLSNDDRRTNTLVIDNFLNSLFTKENMIEFKLGIIKYSDVNS